MHHTISSQCPDAVRTRHRLACIAGAACGWAFASAHAAAPSWQLWASGLQQGIHPRLAIAPDHSIYYGLLATGGGKGLVYKATDTLAPSGSFVALAPIPYVTSLNNIQGLTTTKNSEPVAGIFHYANSSDPDGSQAHLNDPIAFVLDKDSGQWIAATVSVPANLGVFAMSRAPNGDIWFGAKWSRVYKSTDNGRSYSAIDDTAKVTQSAPCYYPNVNGAQYDGAIYAINVDARGWVYAGTEGAGVIYSNDDGTSWRPVDAFACLAADPTQRNPASPMEPVSRSGNLGAIGFTKDNNPVWNGTQLFYYNWPSGIGFADLAAQTVAPVQGFPQYFIYTGLQVSRIVTTRDGTLFLHSGTNGSFDPSPPPPPQQSQYSMGIYQSSDGINWTQFNTGITSTNDGLSEGALAVDGYRVFTATTDGKVWFYDSGDGIFADGFGN